MKEIRDHISRLDFEQLVKPIEELKNCRICPRNCNADRFSDKRGYCKAGTDFTISSIFPHRGEEPVISGDRGICNIFFTNCNLQCIYCQNHQISCNSLDYGGNRLSLPEVLERIATILATGINHVGFVSPGHFIPHVKVIVDALREMGLNPVFVYNTNGYDTVESIRGLQGYIDIYLPDFKYSDENLGRKYSDVKNYPAVALEALKEMVRQKGTGLPVDNRGYATNGVIVRHLVLPGHPVNSINVLRTIAYEVSNQLHISLMSQFYPTYLVQNHESLGRTISEKEYQRVTEALHKLGFSKGWVQDFSSHESYRPDFEEETPFI